MAINLEMAKKAQEQKSKILASMPKKAQEEMVGFAMIIIIVAVVLLILIGVYVNSPKEQAVESYEVESFIQAVLQQTSGCTQDSGLSYQPVQDLISDCDSGAVCSDGIPACSALNSTFYTTLKAAWPAGQDRPIKGYELNITSQNNNILSLKEGNLTLSYKEGVQTLPKRGITYSINFRVYY